MSAALKPIRSPTQKKQIRATIPPYCHGAVANEWRIHYSQNRPFRYYDDLRNARYASLDCSGFVGAVFWNAMHDTKIFIHDPLDCRYTGNGWTGTLEGYLRRFGKAVEEENGYLVGDISRWGRGNHAHTAVCSKAGSATAAEWTSHGREEGPVNVKLHYRKDLIGAWRIPELI